MDRDVIGEIKKRLDIVDLIGDYVQLRKVGRNYRALCPFHTEKTPSFYVSPERQTYHCFGCGKGGDAFTFLMEIEGVSFPQALERLAKRAGVTLSKSARPKAEGDLSEVMELALKFYRDALHSPSGEVARSYLKHRELPPEVWETFELGWAPPSWDYLWQSLQRHGVTFELAERCGLVLMGSRSPYDRFRGRVMFPVRDVSGKLVAFGGRLVVGEGAKYINSPESELFQKRNCLYLLERAKKSIRQRGRSILVEGYTDAIRLHISGYPEAIASLGTSLTEDQAKLLQRFAGRCCICYDADTSGQEASLRGMYILQREGLQVSVVILPRDVDPDQLLLQENGDKVFGEALDHAVPLPLYHLEIRRSQLEDPGSRHKAILELLEGLAELSPFDVAPYISNLSIALGVLPGELNEQIAEIRSRKRAAKEDKSARSSVYINGIEKKSVGKTTDPIEAAVAYVLWNDARRRVEAPPEVVLPLINDERVKSIVAALLYGESPEELEGRWLSVGDRFPMSLIAMGGNFCDQFGDIEVAWKELLRLLERRRRSERYRKLLSAMAKGEASAEEMEELRQLASDIKGGG